MRAFLIEEQKCVKQVLAEKISQAKEKEGGKKPHLGFKTARTTVDLIQSIGDMS